MVSSWSRRASSWCWSWFQRLPSWCWSCLEVSSYHCKLIHIKSRVKPMSQLRFDYDTTIRYDDVPRRIRLRRKWSELRFAFDSTAIRLRHDCDEKNWHVNFLLASNRVEWKQARATTVIHCSTACLRALSGKFSPSRMPQLDFSLEVDEGNISRQLCVNYTGSLSRDVSTSAGMLCLLVVVRQGTSVLDRRHTLGLGRS